MLTETCLEIEWIEHIIDIEPKWKHRDRSHTAYFPQLHNSCVDNSKYTIEIQMNKLHWSISALKPPNIIHWLFPNPAPPVGWMLCCDCCQQGQKRNRSLIIHQIQGSNINSSHCKWTSCSLTIFVFPGSQYFYTGGNFSSTRRCRFWTVYEKHLIVCNIIEGLLSIMEPKSLMELKRQAQKILILSTGALPVLRSFISLHSPASTVNHDQPLCRR